MRTEILRYLDPPKSIKILLMRLTQETFLVGALGIIFNEEKKILLFKNMYNKPEWGLPGGYLKAKEKPEDGLIREVREESGLNIETENLITVLSDEGASRITLVYLAKIVGGHFKPSYEISEHDFFSLNDLPKIPIDHSVAVSKLDKYLTKK